MKNTKTNATDQKSIQAYQSNSSKNNPCHKCNLSKNLSEATDTFSFQPQMRIKQAVFTEIIFEICPRPVEAGGLLLGPIGSNDITDFYYDQGANSSGVTYSPDYITLGKKMKEEWMPSGLDMKGFVHSHPGNFDCHSRGDLIYIARLLKINPDMDIFFAPIIIPSKYFMRPLAVLRDNPNVSVEAKLVLF